MAHAQHTLDIYGVELHVVTSRAEWNAMRRRIRGGVVIEPLPNPVGSGYTHSVQAGSRVVCATYLRATDAPRELVDTCAHEATHVAAFVYESIEDTPAGEPHAYLVGWLAGWLYDAATSG